MNLQLQYHDVGIDTLNNKSHFHDKEFEILHVINGDGTIMIKDELYALNSNTIFFIKGSDTHYTSPANLKNYIRNKIIFFSEILTNLAKNLDVEKLIENLFLNGGTAVPLSAEASLKIDKCFLSLSQLSDSNPESFNINLFINLFTIIDIAIKNDKAKNLNNKISEIISFINQNIQNKITLDLICENLNISKYYLCQKFKNTVGMTVFEYIEFSRISLAKDLLIKTDFSISDISQKAGFESFAYFSKVFRKFENCTPSQYRKQNAIF